MTALAYRLLERFLPSASADAVVGDLMERGVSGVRLWRETAVAIWHLRDRTPQQVELMSTFLSDLRLAARLLGRAPTFAITAILTLGVAIGASTAIFSVANPVLLQPLPYRNSERVMVVWELERDGGRSTVGFTTVRDYIDRATTLESAAAVGGWQPTLDRSERSRAADWGARVRDVFPDARRAAGVRPRLPCGRGRRERAACRPVEPCALAAAVRRRFRGGRPADRHGRDEDDGRRRNARMASTMSRLPARRSGVCSDMP